MLFQYLMRLVKAPLSNLRFVVLTPPTAKRQIVLDKRLGKTISFSTNSQTDYATIVQVFHDMEYDLERIARRTEFVGLFNQIKSSGKSPLILDCGANIGAASRFLSINWPDSVVWAIEPSDRNCQLAQRNLPENAKLIPGAIGANDGYCEIRNPESEPNSFQVEIGVTSDDRPRIRMLSMRSLMDQIADENLEPFILKIDIEGSEKQLFFDGANWLDKWPILMIELHDWMMPGGGTSKPVLRALVEQNRDVLIHNNTLVSLRVLPDQRAT